MKTPQVKALSGMTPLGLPKSSQLKVNKEILERLANEVMHEMGMTTWDISNKKFVDELTIRYNEAAK